MILGRSANLFLGLATTAVALVWGVAAQMGQPLSPELAALVVGFLGAIIAIFASSDSLAIAKGQAASDRLALKGK